MLFETTAWVLWTSANPDLSQDYSSFLKSLSLWSLSNRTASDNLKHNFFVGEDIDETLRVVALRTDLEYCIVLSAGTFFWSVEDLFAQVSQAVLNQDFFIMGHICDRYEQYFELHEQFLVLNLKYYRQFGFPVRGKKERSFKLLQVPRRSLENVHDDYTPLWLKPNFGVERRYDRVRSGWNWINASLSHNVEILNLPSPVRDQKMYVYSENNIEYRDSLYSNLIETVALQRQQIWLYNNEPYLAPSCKAKTVDVLVSVAAGFRSLRMLSQVGCSKSTEMIFYDYSRNALDFKRFLFENWDGLDLPNFIAGSPFKNMSFCPPLNSDNENRLWREELKKWGGTRSFAESWNSFRKLKATFLHLDITREPGQNRVLAELRRLGQEKSYLFWFSNTFFSLAPYILRDETQVARSFQAFVSEVKGLDRDIHLVGVDSLNRTVNESIFDYEFSQVSFEDLYFTSIEQMRRLNDSRLIGKGSDLEEDPRGLRL